MSDAVAEGGVERDSREKRLTPKPAATPRMANEKTAGRTKQVFMVHSKLQG